MYIEIDLSKSKILIVDDNQHNLSLLENVLKQYDYKIVSSMNGEAAYNSALMFDPDLILMDINMPVLNGFDSAALLKNNSLTKDIPIIFITALTDINFIVKAYESGGVDYITKPFKIEELSQKVKTHLYIKILMQELKESKEALSKANNAKDKFFNFVSHDMREPFIATLGITDMILKFRDKFTKEQILDKIVKLNSTLKNQFNATEKLLDWSRVQTNDFEFRPIKINLNKILSNLENIFESYLLDKEISFKINTNNIDLNDKFLYLDELMITSILNNLIHNAIKYTNQGGDVILEVFTTETECQFVVKDNGIGINDDDINDLFKIDVNNSKLGTNKEIGTGLGLILVQEFVDKNNGLILIDSELGIGSNFSVIFPKIVY